MAQGAGQILHGGRFQGQQSGEASGHDRSARGSHGPGLRQRAEPQSHLHGVECRSQRGQGHERSQPGADRVQTRIEERPHDGGVKLSTGTGHQFAPGLIRLAGQLVRTGRGHDVEGIGNGDDPGSQADG
ncbi:MAG: hypothetical protein QOJ19_935, partial [Acidimicrobiia bacterium]|nr:hypothetical protein [Acidimicrobiia bacterium]